MNTTNALYYFFRFLINPIIFVCAHFCVIAFVWGMVGSILTIGWATPLMLYVFERYKRPDTHLPLTDVGIQLIMSILRAWISNPVCAAAITLCELYDLFMGTLSILFLKNPEPLYSTESSKNITRPDSPSQGQCWKTHCFTKLMHIVHHNDWPHEHTLLHSAERLGLVACMYPTSIFAKITEETLKDEHPHDRHYLPFD